MPLEPRLVPLVRLGRRSAADLSIPVGIRRQRAARLSRRGAALVMRREADPASIDHVYVGVAGGEILVRLYRPHGSGPFPLYVFLHGGAWTMGTLDERDARCRAVAAGARCVVASVDYRLAPENRYPTAPEDCYAALVALVADARRHAVDATRVAVGGESAGANLAAAVCLMARDRGGPAVCHQWLDVPALDLTCAQAGHRDVPDGYLLDRAVIEEAIDLYLPDPSMVTEPYCSPLLAEDLAGLPPAWIMSAEFDKLRGDGEAFARALETAGVPAHHVRLAGHIHPSFAFTRLLASSRAYQRAAIDALAAAFARAAR